MVGGRQTFPAKRVSLLLALLYSSLLFLRLFLFDQTLFFDYTLGRLAAQPGACAVDHGYPLRIYAPLVGQPAALGLMGLSLSGLPPTAHRESAPAVAVDWTSLAAMGAARGR
jgi:hypothetical protein